MENQLLIFLKENCMIKITQKRLIIFLLLAFSISWLSALVIFQTGGLSDSPELINGTGITLAVVLEASVYMWGPALANILTRIITNERSALPQGMLRDRLSLGIDLP